MTTFPTLIACYYPCPRRWCGDSRRPILGSPCPRPCGVFHAGIGFSLSKQLSPRRRWAGFAIVGLCMLYEVGLAVERFSMSATMPASGYAMLTSTLPRSPCPLPAVVSTMPTSLFEGRAHMIWQLEFTSLHLSNSNFFESNETITLQNNGLTSFSTLRSMPEVGATPEGCGREEDM